MELAPRQSFALFLIFNTVCAYMAGLIDVRAIIKTIIMTLTFLFIATFLPTIATGAHFFFERMLGMVAPDTEVVAQEQQVHRPNRRQRRNNRNRRDAQQRHFQFVAA